MLSVRPRVAFISKDNELAKRLITGIAGAGCAVDVAATLPDALTILQSRSCYEAVVVDGAFALTHAAGHPRFAETMAAPDELFLVLRRPAEPSTTIHVYRRTSVDSLLDDLTRTLPAELGLENVLLGNTASIRLVREQIRQVARYRDVFVMVLGETGTGKELVARAIHDGSNATGHFVAMNCAAIPESLFESELFGHEAGSYTGARGTRVGLLESAGPGTVFLDEIGEMPLALQAKLLRVLETRMIRRLGSNKDLAIDARIVSATNRVTSGFGSSALRADLLYRLAGFTITLPPLRERAADVGVLVEAFLTSFARRYRRPLMRFSEEALVTLRSYPFPGNVRELRALVDQIGILAPGPLITRDDALRGLGRMPGHKSTVPPSSLPAPSLATASSRALAVMPTTGVHRRGLRDVERDMIEGAFKAAGGNLSKAATSLNIPRSTLRDKLKKYGVLPRKD